ncbi:hypothetical protein BY458DRAFT_514546 [Sporodiniella umbellata]|nr:hypothetical protein BY458DRAFT_514546 [Sporodiniella umbellata]
MNTFICAACQSALKSPITLSCGYTLCQDCLPLTTDDSFVCPVASCSQEKHLFGPDLHQDQLIATLLRGSDKLTCSSEKHTLNQPVTNHCGHTFCRLCLLQHRISSNVCPTCSMRLPSYSYIQQQPINHLIQSLLSPISAEPLLSQATPIPVLSLEFCILPTQRLHLPTPAQLTPIADHLTQSLYIPVVCGSAQTGTLVKIVAVESKWIKVLGFKRFTITPSGLLLVKEKEMMESRMSDDIYNFIQGLAHCAPSNSFCNAATGLLGPVWLNSVQNLHGPLPKEPGALCWWTAIVLPIGNSERMSLLKTIELSDRLALISDWIGELQIQSNQSKPMKPVQVGQ